ncbi:MAG: sugar transferase [Clostridiales bacterium]|nr:sugar transferase [Roseburia sp.]MDD7637317.1 sugar transferase [Clostridiales bacterium]MDY4111546.1 sugar transferase [Roseburia sp.]
MKTKEQYKHLLNYGANLISLAVEGLAFAYIWYTVYEEAYGFYRRGNWAVIGMYVLIIFFFTKVFGGYNIGYMRMTDIALSHVLAILLSGVVGYLELCLITRDYVSPKPILGVMAVEVIFILPWIYIIRKLYARLYPPRQMLVIYGNYSPDDLIKKINTRKDKYNICASVSYEIGHKKLYPLIRKYNAVVLCDLPAQARNQIMKYCYQESIRTYVTPKISDILFRGADDIHLFDTPLLLSRNQGLSIDQRIVKRTWDIVLSLLGIIIASPFMLIIALAVKLYDGGPVLYKQERLTRDGQPFMIYKFRSMSMDSEKNGARLAAKGDKRVTPVGKIIRNIHFDELPQLFNILKGEMSMVGPRPERKEISDKYEEEIPEFILRTKVKAGLTGYAQVYGKYNTTPYDKLKLDLTYIENYSLWLDFKIMLLTFKILFQKENTEGVDKEQTTAMKH